MKHTKILLSLFSVLLIVPDVAPVKAADDFVSSPKRPAVKVAELKLANIFSDRMVLQRDKPVRIWGWAKPGADVRVTFADQAVKTKADKEGSWQLLLEPMKASFENRTLVASSSSSPSSSAGNKEIKISDVLVGEVWVCGGQSNMRWTLAGTTDADLELTSADYPAIRFARIPNNASTNPSADYPLADDPNAEGRWFTCQPEHIASCTAVGYYFGRRLHRFLKVPVGLIDTAWGGTMAQHWTTRERLKKIPEMKPYFENFAAAMKVWNDGGEEAGAKADYEKALAEYEAKIKTLKQGERRPGRPRQRQDPGNGRQPAGMVNGIIAPLSGYTLRGVLFYQGENNSFGESWKPFHATFPAVIDTHRDAFGDPDLPFGIIQIAGWSNRRSMTYDMNHHTNVVREIQFDVWQRTPNTGLIASFDANVDGNIHPRRKLPIGERSARWALAEVYQQKGARNALIAWRGPVFEKMEFDGNKCTLYFNKETAKGLTLNKDVALGFYIAGEDKAFHTDVQARVDRNKNAVIVWSDSVSKPIAVRYAQSNLPIGSLMNGAELPAYPFRTDDWPITPHQSTGSYERVKAKQ